MAPDDSLLSTFRTRYQVSIAQSRLARAVRTAASRTVLSWLGTRLASGQATVRRALQTSAVVQAVSTTGHWSRQSALYRWLTADPDPDVIVIDLRDTYTVGPILALLDQIVTPLNRSYRQSRLRGLERRLAAVATTAAETRPGQFLARMLAPPEPPDTDTPAKTDTTDAQTEHQEPSDSHRDS